MISKSKLKYIKSLQIKKIRKQEGLFLVEGAKSVVELLTSDYLPDSLFLTREFIDCYQSILQEKGVPYTLCTENELNEAGSFVNNNAALAIVSMKENSLLLPSGDEYMLLLDDIKDPGNLGTMLRTADWYGIEKVICSENTAEFYNPKVISATMGSFTRAKIYYCDLAEYLGAYKTHVYGARLEGENVHQVAFRKGGMLLIGNESSGIHPRLLPFIDEHLRIPGFGKAESLNAAIATAILCDNVRRNLNT